jgi:hypothetical protein
LNSPASAYFHASFGRPHGREIFLGSPALPALAAAFDDHRKVGSFTPLSIRQKEGGRPSICSFQQIPQKREDKEVGWARHRK